MTVQDSPETDMKIINLSTFPLAPNHISLLQRGMLFSPTANMDIFSVYKDVALFLRKVFFRTLHQSRCVNLWGRTIKLRRSTDPRYFKRSIGGERKPGRPKLSYQASGGLGNTLYQNAPSK